MTTSRTNNISMSPPSIEIYVGIGDFIPSPTTQYEVLEYLGRGSFGLVTRCLDVSTDETVAIKIVKGSENFHSAKREVATLRTIKELHSDNFNIVRLKEAFIYKTHYWLVFENLDIDLRTFMKMIPGKQLPLKEIRPILQQLATSLAFLKTAKFVHADLKPNNIMMVDHIRKPLKVKIIDFGLASNKPEKNTGETLQSLNYRSPEIVQRVPFNEAIDVWSLGCIAAELFIGEPLFNACNEVELMNLIEYTTGTKMNDEGLKSSCFRLRKWMMRRFMKVHRVWGEQDKVELWDMECFMDLLKVMLLPNPETRITPAGILHHPFIRMSHFKGRFRTASYVKTSKDLMDICRNQSSDDGGHRYQMSQLTSLNWDSSSSLARKKRSLLMKSIIAQAKERKMNAKCGKKPDDSPTKKRSELLADSQKDKSGTPDASYPVLEETYQTKRKRVAR